MSDQDARLALRALQRDGWGALSDEDVARFAAALTAERIRRKFGRYAGVLPVRLTIRQEWMADEIAAHLRDESTEMKT